MLLRQRRCGEFIADQRESGIELRRRHAIAEQQLVGGRRVTATAGVERVPQRKDEIARALQPGEDREVVDELLGERSVEHAVTELGDRAIEFGRAEGDRPAQAQELMQPVEDLGVEALNARVGEVATGRVEHDGDVAVGSDELQREKGAQVEQGHARSLDQLPDVGCERRIPAGQPLHAPCRVGGRGWEFCGGIGGRAADDLQELRRNCERFRHEVHRHRCHVRSWARELGHRLGARYAELCHGRPHTQSREIERQTPGEYRRGRAFIGLFKAMLGLHAQLSRCESGLARLQRRIDVDRELFEQLDHEIDVGHLGGRVGTRQLDSGEIASAASQHVQRIRGIDCRPDLEKPE